VSDVLLISLGTTRGLRIADSMLVRMLEQAGARVDAVGVRIGSAGALRRGYPVNDLVEALAAQRALASALATGRGARGRPRALLFSTTTAAMLARAEGLPYAVRLDSPAALNRPGPHNAIVRALERRTLSRARLVLALGHAGAAALPPNSTPVEIVPVPIERHGGVSAARDAKLAVAYVPDPKAKGLAALCAAWTRATTPGRRLEVFGIEPQRAREFLARSGRQPPAGVEFRGLVGVDEFRARLCAARAFISAARWEDYGQAPLEALSDGALLVTVPAGGPYEALPLARELDPELVAPTSQPADLACAIDAAFARNDPAGLQAYRDRAARLLEPYRSDRALDTLRERVLPLLLNS
jgi:hypothetical protein